MSIEHRNFVNLIGVLEKDARVGTKELNGKSFKTVDFMIRCDKSRTWNGETKVSKMYVVVKGAGKAVADIERLPAGKLVEVEGELQNESWTDKDGQKQRRHVVKPTLIKELTAPAKKDEAPEEEFDF